MVWNSQFRVPREAKQSEIDVVLNTVSPRCGDPNPQNLVVRVKVTV